MAWAVDKGHVAHKFVSEIALLHNVISGASTGKKVARAGALRVLALVDLGIRVAQLDCNVTLEFVLETHSLHSRDGFDDGGLAVSHMSNGTNVDCRLATDDLR